MADWTNTLSFAKRIPQIITLVDLSEYLESKYSIIESIENSVHLTLNEGIDIIFPQR